MGSQRVREEWATKIFTLFSNEILEEILIYLPSERIMMANISIKKWKLPSKLKVIISHIFKPRNDSLKGKFQKASIMKMDMSIL